MRNYFFEKWDTGHLLGWCLAVGFFFHVAVQTLIPVAIFSGIAAFVAAVLHYLGCF